MYKGSEMGKKGPRGTRERAIASVRTQQRGEATTEGGHQEWKGRTGSIYSALYNVIPSWGEDEKF